MWHLFSICTCFLWGFHVIDALERHIHFQFAPVFFEDFMVICFIWKNWEPKIFVLSMKSVTSIFNLRLFSLRISYQFASFEKKCQRKQGENDEKCDIHFQFAPVFFEDFISICPIWKNCEPKIFVFWKKSVTLF